MANFIATNNFKCPHCNEMLDGASGFYSRDKPQNDSFTICVFCAQVCVYVIEKGVISLRALQDEDHKYIEKYPSLQNEIKELQDFVKSKPKK